jgi:hypothetical protein
MIKDHDTIFVEDSYFSNRDMGEEFWKFKIHHQTYIWRKNRS